MKHYEVFVSHSTEDKKVANEIVSQLEKQGVQCWIAPRDIPYGTEYEEELMDAIEACRIFLLIFTPSANASKHVKFEIGHAVENDAVLLPFRLAEFEPDRKFKFYLRSTQYLDASTGDLQDNIEKLVVAIKQRLGKNERPEPSPAPPAPLPEPPPASSLEPPPAPSPELLKKEVQAGTNKAVKAYLEKWVAAWQAQSGDAAENIIWPKKQPQTALKFNTKGTNALFSLADGTSVATYEWRTFQGVFYLWIDLRQLAENPELSAEENEDRKRLRENFLAVRRAFGDKPPEEYLKHKMITSWKVRTSRKTAADVEVNAQKLKAELEQILFTEIPNLEKKMLQAIQDM